MSYTIIGTCGNCGGAVAVNSSAHFGLLPPTPYCVSCGSNAAQKHGPVIEMAPHPLAHLDEGKK